MEGNVKQEERTWQEREAMHSVHVVNGLAPVSLLNLQDQEGGRWMGFTEQRCCVERLFINNTGQHKQGTSRKARNEEEAKTWLYNRSNI